MLEARPARVLVRFPHFASSRWRERCLASLAAAGDVEVMIIPGALTPHQADLILDFSIGALDLQQLAIPRLGYWTFLYGKEPERTEPGLPEFIGGERAAYVRLVHINHPDSATVLREGAVRVVGRSLEATRERLLEAVVDWPGQLLKISLRQTHGPAWPVVRWRQRGFLVRSARRAWVPIARVRNILIRAFWEITREHWTVGVINQSVQQVCESFDPEKIRWLAAPADGFLADPFGLTCPDGTLVIMAEALSWRDGRGRIVAFECRPDGTVTQPRNVLTFATHASYPQLIEHDGVVYCIPETLAQRRVQLFKADPFPSRWVADTVLLEDFAGADATVYLHEGRWWLFAGNHDDQDEAKLFVFHASDLRGPWVPHSANPVKCDLRSARPAGPLFTADGILYRPAQDCSTTYGGAIVINRIDHLTPDEFAEQPVKRLAPAARGPYPDGLHTLTGVGNVTLVDGKRHALSAASLVTHLQRKLQRIQRVG